MHSQRHLLTPTAPGTQRFLVSQHFGPLDRGRKLLLQASLHADEPPGMLLMHHLRERLLRLEAAGQLLAEVVLVPLANPIGVAQQVYGRTQGRFELGSGENFNRHYADLAAAAWARLQPAVDAGQMPDVAAVRAVLRELCGELPAASELASLRRILLGLAIDADWVLDLHCDNEAVMHLYAATPQWPEVEPLARALGAEVALLATDSGDSPFDESCSMLWSRLDALRQGHTGVAEGWPLACVAVTVELRGERDISHELAAADADALLLAAQHAGFIAGQPQQLPPLRRAPTPLAGSMPVVTPAGGVLVPLVQPGAELRRGDPVAEVVDAIDGSVVSLPSPCDGVLYARISERTVQAGQAVAKVAGSQALRSGKLLSA